MSQDYPRANARLAEVGRHWADGEVSHETWRRERRSILREVCNKRADVQGEGVLPALRPAPVAAPVEVTSPDLPAVPAARKTESADPLPPDEVKNDDVLLLALLLILVIVSAVAVFMLA